MGRGLATLNTTFKVGQVRVCLWGDQGLNSRELSYKLTLERNYPQQEKETWSAVLQAADITSAILALKKAHDYLKKSAGQTPSEEHHQNTVTVLPPRIP